MSDISDKYTFVENKDKKWSGIGLTKEAGLYQGVVYEYGKVEIIEDEKNDSATLQFDFNVLDSNGMPQKMFGEDWYKLIGDILSDLISKQLDEGDMQYVNTDD
jgi:hypothetical protein